MCIQAGKGLSYNVKSNRWSDRQSKIKRVESYITF